jgi:RNA polymerase sigma-70 factor (ECF subfamily)
LTEERALIARAARGESDAFGALVAAHRPYVVRIARHLVGEPATAEDIAQDAFVRLQGALPGFRGESALRTWLYRVTLNLCRDHMRRQSRRRGDITLDDLHDSPKLALGAGADPRVDAHRAVDAERARHTIRAAIDRLPEEQREAVVLRYVEELSYAEIARLTHTPQGTIASRVFRALERLGRELEPHHLEVVK